MVKISIERGQTKSFKISCKEGHSGLPFYQERNRKNTQDRLFCGGGFSTSLLVNKMKAYAQSIGYDCTIDAHSYAQVEAFGNDADIVLLGPQIKYEIPNIKAKLNDDVIVEAIVMKAYGLMDVKAVIDHVKQVLGDQ